MYGLHRRACPKFWQSVGTSQTQSACISGDMYKPQLAYHDLVYDYGADGEGDVMKVILEPYCENCPEIAPVAMQWQTHSVIGGIQTLTQGITCKHIDRCKAIAEHIKSVGGTNGSD